MSRKIDLGDALKGVGDAYVRENPADLAGVRSHVETYRRRRRFVLVLAGVVASASLLLLGVFITSLDLGSERRAPRPAALTVDLALDLGSPGRQVEARGDDAFVALEDGSIAAVDLRDRDVTWTADFDSRAADVVWGKTGLWATFPEEDLLRRIDLTSGALIEEIHLEAGDAPSRLTVGARAIRVVTTRGVERISLPGGEHRSLFEGDITDIAMGHSGFWLVNTRGAIFAIDPDTGVPVAGLSADERAPGGEITFARGVIWYGRSDADALIMIDETTGARRTRIPLPGGYLDLDAGANGPWVLSRASGGAGVVTSVDAQIAELGTLNRVVEGNPVDLSTGAGGIWVVGEDTTEIVHLQP